MPLSCFGETVEWYIIKQWFFAEIKKSSQSGDIYACTHTDTHLSEKSQVVDKKNKNIL